MKYYGGVFDNEENAAMTVNCNDKCQIECTNPTIDTELIEDYQVIYSLFIVHGKIVVFNSRIKRLTIIQHLLLTAHQSLTLLHPSSDTIHFWSWKNINAHPIFHSKQDL